MIGGISSSLQHRNAAAVLPAETRALPRIAKTSARSAALEGLWTTAGLSAFAVFVHGYHPYSEDGGVYLAGVLRLLHPQLYPYETGFVTAHLHFSQFAHIVVALVRLSHLDVMTVLFGLYIACTWLTLFAGWRLATRLTTSAPARFGAVALLAAVLTMPIAGTSLILMDPYLTGRSLSTPLGLLALAYAIDARRQIAASRSAARRSLLLAAICLLAAAPVHPLMAVYSLGLVLLYFAVSLDRLRMRIIATGALCALALAGAACLDALAPAQSTAYARVALTRAYWFLGGWHWYELLGLVAPPIVLLLLLRAKSPLNQAAARPVIWMLTVAAALSLVIAALFVSPSSSSFLVARLQPLRVYLTIYILMILALGAYAGEHLLKRSAQRHAAFLVALGGAMAFAQYRIYPHSAHLEYPWAAPANPWVQSFIWIRDHTAPDAVVALDSHYIAAADEDSQNFRAIAQRSSLADYSKDGGIAAITPELTAEWSEGEAVQQGLDRGVDLQELARLQAHSVSWFVVPSSTPVAIPCAWSNYAVKVCAVPGAPDASLH